MVYSRCQGPSLALPAEVVRARGVLRCVPRWCTRILRVEQRLVAGTGVEMLRSTIRASCTASDAAEGVEGRGWARAMWPGSAVEGS